jgi:hypothetical protein
MARGAGAAGVTVIRAMLAASHPNVATRDLLVELRRSG